MIILISFFFFWYSPLCVVQTVQWKLQPELLTYNEIITSVTLWTNREHYYLEFMAEPFYWIVLHFKGGHWLCCTEAILICQRVSNFFSISTYRPL